MSLNTKRLLFVILSFFTLSALSAQTLYWVGGSGNFSDPKHWSLTSGGFTANQIPNSATNVVFDDNSGKGYFLVSFAGENKAKNFSTAQLQNSAVKFTGSISSTLHIAGSIVLSNRVRFATLSELIFESTSTQLNTINFGSRLLNNNLTFKNGNYEFVELRVGDGNTLSFGGGNYIFKSAIVSAGNVINADNKARFDFKESYFFTKGKFKIAQQATIHSENLYVMADVTSANSYSVPLSLSASKGYTNVNSVTAFCPVTISLTPACSGSCTGVLTVSLAPTCTTTPYSVQVSNPSCPALAAAYSNTNIPSVYTVTNACACAANYIIVVRDGSSTIQAATNTANFTPNSAIIFDNNVSPSCSYSCNGALQGFIIGTSPFNVSVTAPGTVTIPSFTSATGDYTIAGMCAGVYTFNVTDAGGCSTTITNTLTGPATLSANAVTSSITCNGFNTGSLTISPAGGIAGYTVNFSNSTTFTTNGSAVSATGLGVGAISATITDVNSCTTTVNSNIIQPTASLSAIYSQTNLACNNVCIGAASALLSGGTPPYSYSWTPGPGTGSAVTGLCAGTRTLIVRDFNNCTTSSVHVFTITQPPAITLTPTSTNVVCSGSCTGAASIATNGGTGPFTFTWVAPGPSLIPGSTSSKTGLCSFPTNYSVTVRDANNCTSPVVLINISQPPTMTLSMATRSVSCFGLLDGGATVTASGGNGAPYTYSWNPTALTTSAITGIGPGNYQVTVRDASNCPRTATAAIIQPTSGLSVAITQTNLTCHQGNALPCTGRINLTSSGGVPAYSYTLAGPTSSSTASPPYNNLCSGSYTVFARDASGCTVSPSVVTVTQPNIITPTITVTTPISCFGTSIGGLTGGLVSPPGGTPGYTLNWVTPTGAATGTNLVNRGAGNYTLTVVDSKSCSASTSITFTSPSQMTVTAGTSSISCFNVCNGVLTSTVSGGTGPYTYAWTNSLSVNVGTNSTATSLCPGPYTLTVIDALACTRTVAATVLSPAPLVLTQTATPVSCFGDSNGSATVTASGGTAPYVSYNFVAPTATITNASGIIGGQPTATFTVTVTDNAGCTQTISTAITSPTALAAAISGTGSCNVCNGTATVTPSFGTAPYNFLWSSASGTIATTSTVGGLCPGTYTAVVTDFRGCSITRTININQIINIGIIPAPSSILCNGATTGSVGSTVTGGVPGYSYSWTPSSQTTPSLVGVGAGTYTLRVTDSSLPASCSHTVVVTLTEPPAITVTATQTNVTCFGFNTGAITTSVSGGTGSSYTYSWSPGAQTTSALTGLSSGIYTLEVEDVNLCLSTQIYTVTQSPSITITHTAVNPSGCAIPNGSICVTASGGSGSGYTYAWSPVAGTGNCLSGLNGGTYQHTVTDGAGCTNSISVTLFNATGPTLTAVSSSVACFGASTGAATLNATGVAPFTFTWSPSVSTATITNGSVGSGLSSGNYAITVSDVNGCVTSTNVTIIQAASVTINSSLTNARCNAQCDGSITVAPTQGTLTSPPFTYSWLPVTPTITGQGTGTVTNLCANPYTLNLTDGNNCQTQYTFSVTQPTAIAISAVTSSLLCNSACTGSIVATATGGVGSLNYSWAPVGGNTQTVTNLCATGGTNPAFYTLTVTDQQSCTAVGTYTIAEPPPLTNTVSFVNASCSNSCNAIASQTASGGTPVYSYSWSSSTVSTSSLGSLCPATSYTAIVTDANGCVFSNAYTTPSVTPLTLTLAPSNPLCNNECNGSITTSVSGAQGAMSYTWAPAGSGQNPTGLCATPNPIYTVVASDQNLCQVTATTALLNPPALIASVSATNPLCNGNTNGSATVTFTNNVGATTYTWLTTGPPTQTAQTATGLSAGNYTVLVRDNNQCLASTVFTLTNPSTITVNSSIGAPSCSLSNGTISLNPSGGTPGTSVPYTYSWTTIASTSSVVTGLSAGLYPVIVTDGLGCTSSSTLLLSNLNGPGTVPVVSTSVTCNLQCTGTASIDLSGIVGGTPPYTATWIAPITSTLNSITELCAGSYTAQIQDAVGCISFTDVVISEPPPVINTNTVSLPLCAGICDGSISVSTSGGNAPYTYEWLPTNATTSAVSNLCAGDYTLILSYNGVCSDTSFFNLPDQSTISVSPLVTDNTCFGNCNGFISLGVSGGASPYSASWSNGQSGLVLSGLCNNTYSVVVSDNNGCSSTATAVVSSGPPIITSAAITSPSCGLCNGSASLTATGGTAPFTYTWSNAATTSNVSNLCAGIYQVVISDALACTQTETIIVNNTNGITGENIDVQQIPCSGACVGAATVTAIGGTAPITYNWTSPPVTGPSITDLCPGTYYVQMSDLAGCIRIASLAINPVVSLSVSPFVNQPSCGSSDGSIALLIGGGTPSYSVVWNPPTVQTTTLTNLTSGAYSYTVTESGTNSCSVSQTLNVSNSDGPIIEGLTTNINCFGACNGAVSANVTSTNTPLSLVWSNGITNTPTVTNLCQGVITLTVTDAAGCQALESFTVTQRPRLLLGITNVQNSVCDGDCNGSINLVPNGGTTPYTYSWSVGSETLNPASNLCDGVYSATVTDVFGCTVNSPSYSITSASSISLDINAFNSSCSSVADGSINLTPSGGLAEYNVIWQGPSNYTAALQSISNIFSGEYTVSIEDAVGCRKDTTVLIVPSITVVAQAGNDRIICPETGTVVLDAGNSSGSVDYKWFLLDDKVNSIGSGPTLFVEKLSQSSSYIVVATSTVESCSGEDTVKVNLHVLPAVNAGRDYTVPIYTKVTLGGYPTNWTPVTLSWSPSIYLSDSTVANPVASNTVNVTYTLTVIDGNGCIAQDSVHVHLYPELNITSGFTPNNDGKNDLWIIDYIDQFPSNSVEIYNRWGDMIFSSSGYQVPFDGKYKGTDLPVGTYYYIIKLNHPGYPKPITGPLTIFR